MLVLVIICNIEFLHAYWSLYETKFSFRIVRSIAAADKYLISSGADETVKIFNLRNRTEHGTLNHSDAMINAMTFYDKKHLITCAEDGKVCILKTGTWNVEKTLLKHTQGM